MATKQIEKKMLNTPNKAAPQVQSSSESFSEFETGSAFPSADPIPRPPETTSMLCRAFARH